MDVSDEMFAAVLLVVGMPPKHDVHNLKDSSEYLYSDIGWQLNVVNFADVDLDKRKWFLKHYIRWLMERDDALNR